MLVHVLCSLSTHLEVRLSGFGIGSSETESEHILPNPPDLSFSVQGGLVRGSSQAGYRASVVSSFAPLFRGPAPVSSPLSRSASSLVPLMTGLVLALTLTLTIISS